MWQGWTLNNAGAACKLERVSMYSQRENNGQSNMKFFRSARSTSVPDSLRKSTLLVTKFRWCCLRAGESSQSVAGQDGVNKH